MYALFPIVLFIIGTVIFIGLPVVFSLRAYFRNRGRRTAICPENHQPVEIAADRKFAFWTALRGQEHSRLESCSRWPERADCDQDCLAQIDPSPENLERLLAKWYQGKACGICGRILTQADWRRSRLALLNEKQKLFELRHMHLDELPTTLDRMVPLCWNCHQEERARQAKPSRLFKGDRHTMDSAVND